MTNQPSQPEQRIRRSEQPEIVDTPESGVNQPEVSPDEPLRFDGERSQVKREEQAVSRAPALATGMFLPVVVILIVAIVVIIWIVL